MYLPYSLETANKILGLIGENSKRQVEEALGIRFPVPPELTLEEKLAKTDATNQCLALYRPNLPLKSRVAILEKAIRLAGNVSECRQVVGIEGTVRSLRVKVKERMEEILKAQLDAADTLEKCHRFLKSCPEKTEAEKEAQKKLAGLLEAKIKKTNQLITCEEISSYLLYLPREKTLVKQFTAKVRKLAVSFADKMRVAWDENFPSDVRVWAREMAFAEAKTIEQLEQVRRFYPLGSDMDKRIRAKTERLLKPEIRKARTFEEYLELLKQTPEFCDRVERLLLGKMVPLAKTTEELLQIYWHITPCSEVSRECLRIVADRIQSDEKTAKAAAGPETK